MEHIETQHTSHTVTRCVLRDCHRPSRLHPYSSLTPADTASRTLPYWYRDKCARWLNQKRDTPRTYENVY